MALEHTIDSAFAMAVRKAGTQTAFGNLIGKRQSVISGWLTRNIDRPEEHVLPAEYVRTIEAATGISRFDLRPDIFCREDSQLAQGAPEQPLAGSRDLPADGSTSTPASTPALAPASTPALAGLKQ